MPNRLKKKPFTISSICENGVVRNVDLKKCTCKLRNTHDACKILSSESHFYVVHHSKWICAQRFCSNSTWNHIRSGKRNVLLRLEVWRKVIFGSLNGSTHRIQASECFRDALGDPLKWNVSFNLRCVNLLLACQKCGVDQENEMSMSFDGSALQFQTVKRLGFVFTINTILVLGNAPVVSVEYHSRFCGKHWNGKIVKRINVT